MRAFLVSFFFLASFSAFGAQQIWDFSDREDLEEPSDLVYNQTLGVLHPSLKAISGATTYVMDVGNGQHGSFDSSTYAQFSEGGDLSGNRIRLNTDEWSSLKVTNFHLEAGWILDVQGSKELVILSQTDVIIDGVILCHGDNGTDAALDVPGEGGKGRCGGGDGGDGGLSMEGGDDGGDVPGVVSGGKGGNYVATGAVGGGGGGSWNDSSVAGNGDNSSALGGEAGSMDTDPGFATTSGGGGGGGGSGFGVNESGGGGGGGGGLVLINAVRDFELGATGEIRAWGGNGGEASGNAGGGGAGAGGSVLVLVGRDVNIINVNPRASDTDHGVGGSAGTIDGGDGGIGRNWFTSARNFTTAGGYFPTEQPPFAPGVVEFENSLQRAESVSFDLRNTRVQFESLSFSPQSSDFQVEISGSDDNFNSDDTGWTTDLDLIEGKRYVKLRASITATDVTEPDMMDAITLTYNPGDASKFDFQATGCARLGPSSPPSVFLMTLFLLPLLVIFLGFKIRCYI